jgi:bifunctional DNase/RNase
MNVPGDRALITIRSPHSITLHGSPLAVLLAIHHNAVYFYISCVTTISFQAIPALTGSCMLIAVELATFGVDPEKNLPIIMLRERSGNRTISLPLGIEEAHLVAMRLLDTREGASYWTELFSRTVEYLGGKIERCVIHDFAGEVFKARIQISNTQGACLIECRPCEAISLALRHSRPLFVDDTVFDKIQEPKPVPEEERLRKTIANINVVDFGRYQLE